MDKYFVISVDKVRVLNEKQSHIASLFKSVEVRTREIDKDHGKQWVYVSSSTGNNIEEVETVKAYIDALCDSPETTTRILEIDKYPSLRNPENIFNLEKKFGVVATVDDNLQKLNIKGSDINAVLAESWIDENHRGLPKSDKEPIDMMVTDGSINPSLKEFALKLGYSEQDVNSVAKKFGPDVDQNQLLRELIHHKGTTSRSITMKGIADGLPRGSATNFHRGQIVARGATPVRAAETKIRDSIRGEECAPRTRGVSPSTSEDSRDTLLPVVIDGSNVAMSHGNQKVFSCRGIELCVHWFKERGHKEIYAMVPKWRTETPRMDYPITDQYILQKLANQNFVKFTPSRRVAGRNIVCYDDRFIVDLAYKLGGVVVSNDNYRDLQRENPEWKKVIENRLLMYSFVGNYFMVPDDPLGKYGPNLKEFLQKGTKSHPQVCPHITRCTYGSKCRYYHPERDPKRRQELLSGKPRQAGRGSSPSSYDTRTRFVTDAAPYETPTIQQAQYPWSQYVPPPTNTVTTTQHYRYSSPPPYTSYNYSSNVLNEDNLQHEECHDHVRAHLVEMFGEDPDKLARLQAIYSTDKRPEEIVEALLNDNL